MEKAAAYPRHPGKNARLVADWCRRGDVSRALKRAPHAIGELEAMHPDLWSVWAQAPDDAFLAVVPGMDPREVDRLKAARDDRGRSALCALAASPRKLAAMAELGWDLAAPEAAWIGGASVSLAVWCAAQGDAGALLGLARMGAPAPGMFSAADGVSIDKGLRPRCALHLLAGGERLRGWAEGAPEAALAEVVAWMSSGAPLDARGGHGADALGMAIDAGRPQVARALLDAGLDPRRVDAKGRDALALIERRARAMSQQSDPIGAAGLRALRGAVLSRVERLGLDAIHGDQSPAPRKARSL